MRLNVLGISKRFGNDWALRDIALTVDNTEVFGILGSPGSGKSVLLDILGGTVRPSSGTFEIVSGDGSASGTAKLVRPFSEKPQRPRLLRLFSSPQPAQTLSPGELEAAIERAFETASLVLLDEPFANLEQDAKGPLAETVLKLARSSGKIVIVASKSFHDVCLVCDRAAILIQGEVVQTGTPKEMYDTPASQSAALLTGRMNIFEGRRLSSSKAAVPEFITLKGKHRIVTKRTELRTMGAMNKNATLGIRPEDLHISFGASFPADNLLRAAVTDTQFFGDHTRVMLDAAGLALQAQVNKLVGLGVGEECIISLPPENIHFL